MPQYIVIQNQDHLNALNDKLKIRLAEGKPTTLEVKQDTRTEKQNSSLHLYFQQVAQALNDEGITFEMFFKQGYQVEWSKEIVKNEIWRTVQKAVTGKTSTTRPTTGEYVKIYDYVNLKLAEHGIHVAWPSVEEMRKQAQIEAEKANGKK